MLLRLLNARIWITCASSRDQTKRKCLRYHIEGAAPSALSIHDRVTQKNSPERLSSTFSPGSQNASQFPARRKELDIATLGSAQRSHSLVAEQESTTVQVLELETDLQATRAHGELEKSGTDEHLAPPTCTAAAAFFAGCPG